VLAGVLIDSSCYSDKTFVVAVINVTVL